MCGLHDNVKMIGRVVETYYYTLEEDLPCPVEEMQQFIRKLLKLELREIEASKVKYIFCSVQIDGHYNELYYISPFGDISVDDVVIVPHSWYGNVEGVVTKVSHVSEKTAPYPVRKTKKIERIVVKVREERAKEAATIDKLAKDSMAKAFFPGDISAEAK